MAAKLLEGNILVGHELWKDLSVLGISHPAVRRNHRFLHTTAAADELHLAF